MKTSFPIALAIALVCSGGIWAAMKLAEAERPSVGLSAKEIMQMRVPMCMRLDPVTGLALAYWMPRADGLCYSADDPSQKRGRAL